MTELNIKTQNVSYNKLTKQFSHSGVGLIFDTQYLLFNPKTGNRVVFDFVYSTGSEWNINTKWMYQSDNYKNDQLMLAVGNGTPKELDKRSKEYLHHKLTRD